MLHSKRQETCQIIKLLCLSMVVYFPSPQLSYLGVVIVGSELEFVAKVTVPLPRFCGSNVFIWRYLGRPQANHILKIKKRQVNCLNIFGWSTVCPGLIITLLLVVNGNCFFESMTAVKPWNSHENENECSVQNISNINMPESHLVHWMLLWGHCEHPTSMRDPLRAQPQVLDQT